MVKHKKITGLFYNPVIFLISLSLFSASSGVNELISNPLISSRIYLRTGSSNWNILNCMPPPPY